jgi:hypothetical protein
MSVNSAAVTPKRTPFQWSSDLASDNILPGSSVQRGSTTRSALKSPSHSLSTPKSKQASRSLVSPGADGKQTESKRTTRASAIKTTSSSSADKPQAGDKRNRKAVNPIAFRVNQSIPSSLLLQRDASALLVIGTDSESVQHDEISSGSGNPAPHKKGNHASTGPAILISEPEQIQIQEQAEEEDDSEFDSDFVPSSSSLSSLSSSSCSEYDSPASKRKQREKSKRNSKKSKSVTDSKSKQKRRSDKGRNKNAEINPNLALANQHNSSLPAPSSVINDGSQPPLASSAPIELRNAARVGGQPVRPLKFRVRTIRRGAHSSASDSDSGSESGCRSACLPVLASNYFYKAHKPRITFNGDVSVVLDASAEQTGKNH